MANQTIYLAGPDVFRRDAKAHAEKAKALCLHHGYVGLSPVDTEASSSKSIYQGNIALIRQANIVVANLNPFRGLEVDSGTAFEVGMAIALGKRVVGYMGSTQDMKGRVAAHLGPLRDEEGLRDRNGDLVEDFGNPVNLMIAESCELVEGDLNQALLYLTRST